MRRAAGSLAALILASALLAVPAPAQQVPDPAPPAAGSPSAGLPPAGLGAAPAPFKPDATEILPDVWIFSGELQNSHETFSGTLVAAKGAAQFELRLAGGASCDGSDISGEVGLVRLGEITCSDDRMMRALFVPQGGEVLKVFGHVGDERFVASAHLLGTEAAPEKTQTAQPTAPQIQGPPVIKPNDDKPGSSEPSPAPR